MLPQGLAKPSGCGLLARGERPAQKWKLDRGGRVCGALDVSGRPDARSTNNNFGEAFMSAASRRDFLRGAGSFALAAATGSVAGAQTTILTAS